jgi:hypothetical protein
MPISRAQSTSTAQIDPARAKLVDAARTAWIGRLIDLSRRNNLLFYRPVPTSSIDLTSQTPGLMDLLGGRPVTGETLLPDPTVGTSRVSSFAHTDIDTTKVREGTGLEFLRNYLQYASSNGTVFCAWRDQQRADE